MPVSADLGWPIEAAGRLVRPAAFACAAAALALFATPALAQDPLGPLAPVEHRADGGPNWFADPGAADAMLALIATARLDGIDALPFQQDALADMLGRADFGDPRDRAMAERALDDTLVTYVTALHANAGRGWTVVDKELSPGRVSPNEILRAAADAPSLADYIGQMRFMPPCYAQMRAALAEAREQGNAEREALLAVNLERLRMLPASGRYVLVNAAAQTLQMVEDGRVVDEMKVVVGKAAQPTPMMAALIRFTAANPYWNLPQDLVGERVAPNVLKEGNGYLKRMGYVILSDYGDNAVEVDPATIDWQAVKVGRVLLRMRQNPGPHNAMGDMKFMFPNAAGVYLHDTPNKELLGEAARMFSAGCVRLEDAPRLGRWLYGKPIETKGLGPEAAIPLDRPVPVYLGYFTAMPSSDGATIATYQDIYNRDQQAQASVSDAMSFARR